MSDPQSGLANLLYGWIPGLIEFFGGLVAIYLLIIFLPLIVQVFLNMILSIFRNQFKFDIRPLVHLFFFPGSMLRLTMVWLVLKTQGFEYRLGFIMPDAGESASSINRRYRGLSYYSYQVKGFEKKVSHLKLAFMVSLASYAIVPIFLIMLAYSTQILITLSYFLPQSTIFPIYHFLLLSILFGGLPVPEETLAVLYAIIYTSPGLVVSFILNILATLILAPYVGINVALTIFMVVTSFNVLFRRVYEEVDHGLGEDTQVHLMELVSGD